MHIRVYMYIFTHMLNYYWMPKVYAKAQLVLEIVCICTHIHTHSCTIVYIHKVCTYTMHRHTVCVHIVKSTPGSAAVAGALCIVAVLLLDDAFVCDSRRRGPVWDVAALAAANSSALFRANTCVMCVCVCVYDVLMYVCMCVRVCMRVCRSDFFGPFPE